jgi:hypothetical protein
MRQMTDGDTGKTLVANAEQMPMQLFLRHCQARHPEMGYRGRLEHRIDHMAADYLDHVHGEPKTPEEMG